MGDHEDLRKRRRPGNVEKPLPSPGVQLRGRFLWDRAATPIGQEVLGLVQATKNEKGRKLLFAALLGTRLARRHARSLKERCPHGTGAEDPGRVSVRRGLGGMLKGWFRNGHTWPTTG